MSTVLARLARWAFTRRRRVLAGWLIVAIATIAVSGASGGKTNDDFSIPGTEAQQVTNVLAAKVPQLAGGQMQVVLKAPSGSSIADGRTAITSLMQKLEHLPGVSASQSPFTTQLISDDGSIAMGVVQFSDAPADVSDDTLDAVKDLVAPLQADGYQVAFNGSVYPGWVTKPSEAPELIGLVIAFLILIIAFGSVVAASLPILSAVIGVIVTLMGVTAVASVVNVAAASTTVAIMLGLSCGIDYGLFLISRYRHNLLSGMKQLDAVGLAAGTAGGSVVFAGLTVIVALCGLLVTGIPFLRVMGLAAAGSVLIALLIALTLVPAMLGFAGVRVLPRKLRDANTATLAVAASDTDRGFGASWGRFVVRARWPIAIAGVALLAAIAGPALDMRLGLPSGASKPTSDTQRQADDLTTEAFGPGQSGPLLVTASPASTSDAKALVTRLKSEDGVASASLVADRNEIAVIQVVPTTGPSDQATTDLVNRLRDSRSALAGSGRATVLVGGKTASNIDVSNKLWDALPVFLIAVVGLALMLLTFAFRTILVPLKSVIGFLLSAAAAFGAEVAVFQWGWGDGLLNIPKSDTVSFLPIIMLAIIFGLSSDYEVFVVSRIKEELTAGQGARTAVITGMSHATRVVTAATLIMFSIFVAFMLTPDPTIRAIGFSFAVGVFLDAFVVRLAVVPAVLAIVGAPIWWHPAWFDRLVPDPDIEGMRLEHLYSETV